MNEDAADGHARWWTPSTAPTRAASSPLDPPLGDFDIREEALHDAFKRALEQWPRNGVPPSAARGWFCRPLQSHRRDRRAPGSTRWKMSRASRPPTDDAAARDKRAARRPATLIYLLPSSLPPDAQWR